MPPSTLITPQAEWWDVPIIGSHIAKVGRIIDLWWDPCSPTPEIWALGLWQAVPTAFLSIAKPELWDVGIPSHRPRKRKGLKGIVHGALKYTDSIIEVPLPRWAVFRAFELTERLGWYLLLADVTEQLLINWMSLAYELQGCGKAHEAYGQYWNDGLVHIDDAPGSYIVWFPSSELNMSSTPTGKKCIAKGPWRASASVDITPHPALRPRGWPTSIAIVDVDSGRIIAMSESHSTNDGSYKASVTGTDDSDEPTSPRYGVRVIGNEGWAEFNAQASFTVSTVADKWIGADP